MYENDFLTKQQSLRLSSPQGTNRHRQAINGLGCKVRLFAASRTAVEALSPESARIVVVYIEGSVPLPVRRCNPAESVPP